MLKVKKVSFDYIRRDEEGDVEGITRALDDVELSVQEGDFIAVLGHNGSGKSTLAKHLNAILLPTEGSVWVAGMDTADDDSLLDIRRTAGMVFQNPDNQMVATVCEDDVAFGPENLGVPSARIREIVDESLAAVGMSEYAKAEPHRLSGGQKQRIAIAGVLAMNTEMVIFDEATAMLDPHGREEVLSVVEKLRERGIGVVMITHYMEEARLADEVVVLSEGKIIKKGRPEEIFRDGETLSRAGLCQPQSVELYNELRRKGIELPDALTVSETASNIYEALKRNGKC